jgi:hypothetical protein
MTLGAQLTTLGALIQIVASLTGDSIYFIYNVNIFIIQATSKLQRHPGFLLGYPKLLVLDIISAGHNLTTLSGTFRLIVNNLKNTTFCHFPSPSTSGSCWVRTPLNLGMRFYHLKFFYRKVKSSTGASTRTTIGRSTTTTRGICNKTFWQCNLY